MKYADVEKALSDLSDSDLERIIKSAQKMTTDRAKTKKDKAIESAAALLAEVGLTLNPSALAAKRTPAKSKSSPERSIAAGKRYVNPADQSQVWTSGRGRRPAWVKELESKGQLDSAEA